MCSRSDFLFFPIDSFFEIDSKLVKIDRFLNDAGFSISARSKRKQSCRSCSSHHLDSILHLIEHHPLSENTVLFIDRFWKFWQETCQYWQVLKIASNRPSQTVKVLQNRRGPAPIVFLTASIPGYTRRHRFLTTFSIDKFSDRFCQNWQVSDFLTSFENHQKSVFAANGWSPESRGTHSDTIPAHQYTWLHTAATIFHNFFHWQLSDPFCQIWQV